MIAVGYFCPII